MSERVGEPVVWVVTAVREGGVVACEVYADVDAADRARDRLVAQYGRHYVRVHGKQVLGAVPEPVGAR